MMPREKFPPEEVVSTLICWKKRPQFKFKMPSFRCSCLPYIIGAFLIFLLIFHWNCNMPLRLLFLMPCKVVKIRYQTPITLNTTELGIVSKRPILPCTEIIPSVQNELNQLFELWATIFPELKKNKSPSQIMNAFDYFTFSDYQKAFVKRSRARKEIPWEDYKHNVTGPRYNGSHVCFDINEYIKGYSSKGGSSFQLTVRGEMTIDASRSYDFWNGSYSTCCRYFERTHVITLVMYFRDLRAYISRLPGVGPIDPLKVLFFHKVTLDENRNPISFILKPIPHNKYITGDEIKDRYDVQNIRSTRKDIDVAVSMASILSIKPIGNKDEHIRLVDSNKDTFTRRNPYDPQNKNTSFNNTYIGNIKKRFIEGHEVCHVMVKGHWVFLGNEWRVQYLDHIVARPKPSFVKRCLEEYDSITIASDSHMRNLYQYFMIYLTGPSEDWSKKQHSDLRFNHYHFAWRPRLQQLNKYLVELKDSIVSDTFFGKIPQKKNKRGNLIVINSGHWNVDVDEGSAGYFTYVRKTLELLKELAAISRKKEVTLVWLSHPPFTFKLTSKGYGRNNFLLAALNDWIKNEIVKIGIRYFDYFEFLFPLNDYHVCNGHYMCVIPRLGEALGSPGRAVADLILYDICS